MIKKLNTVSFLSLFLMSAFLCPVGRSEAFGNEPSVKLAIFITGLNGSHQFRVYFRGAVHSLASVLSKNGYEYKNMVRLGQQIEDDIPWGMSSQSTAVDIQKTLRALAEKKIVYEQLFIFVAGHANGRDDEAKLHLPGPDITYSTLMQWLEPLSAKQEVVILAIPQGQSWIEKFSKPGRIIIAGGALRDFDFIPAAFLQMFPNMFQAAEVRATPDSDGYANLQDVFAETQKRVQLWYATNNLKYTELALLDANGDSKGDSLIQEGLGQHETQPVQTENPDDYKKHASATLPVFRKWLPEQNVSSLVIKTEVPDALEARKIIFRVSGGQQHA